MQIRPTMVRRSPATDRGWRGEVRRPGHSVDGDRRDRIRLAAEGLAGGVVDVLDHPREVGSDGDRQVVRPKRQIAGGVRTHRHAQHAGSHRYSQYSTPH